MADNNRKIAKTELTAAIERLKWAVSYLKENDDDLTAMQIRVLLKDAGESIARAQTLLDPQRGVKS